MAITRTVQPTVIASGFVIQVNEARTGEAKGRRLYAHDITLQDDEGGRFAVRIWLREGADAVPVPAIGEHRSYVAAISERRDQDGTLRAELNVRRILTPGDLDMLHSRMVEPAPAGK